MGQFWITGIFSFCLMGPDFLTTQMAMLLGWPSTLFFSVFQNLGGSLTDRQTDGSPTSGDF